MRILPQIGLVLFIGQSLSMGTQDNAPISLSQPYGGLMASGSTRPYLTNTDLTVSIASFVPLVESHVSVGAVDYGETGLASLSKKIPEIIQRDRGDAYTASGHQILGISIGVGGTSVNDWLSVAAGGTGANYSARIGAVLNQCKVVAGIAGKTLKLTAIYCNLGEKDIQNGMAGSVWGPKIVSLKGIGDAYATTAEGGTPQDVPMFLMHTCSQTALSSTDFSIPLMQTQLVNDDTLNIHSWTPTYPLSFQTDKIHLKDIGYYALGGLGARPYKAVVIEGMKKFKGIYVKNVSRSGNNLIIDYGAPSGRLQLGPTTLTVTTTDVSVTNYGYTLLKPDLSPMTISGVAQSGPLQITLAATETMPEGAVAEYLFSNGPGGRLMGQLHDTSGLVDTLDGFDGFNVASNTLPLHRWAPLHQAVAPA